MSSESFTSITLLTVAFSIARHASFYTDSYEMFVSVYKTTQHQNPEDTKQNVK
jgi:hypothetical protein